MSKIVRNFSSGGNMYRWNGNILRTPIAVRVMPDQKKICQIGDPRQVGADGYLRHGFQGNGTSINVVQSVGYQLVNQWINGQPRWLDASGGHDPEFVWYQGAYSTAAPYIFNGKLMSEAYAQLPGFHFTLPTVTAPLQIVGVKVYFDNMGCVWAYGPATDRNANNKNILQSEFGPSSGWGVNFYVLNTPTCNYHPINIVSNNPSDYIETTQYGTTGQFQQYRDIWNIYQAQQKDGCIPILTNPVRQSYTMSAQTLAHFTSNGAGWIVPAWTPTLTSTTVYTPTSGWGGDGHDNYWACVSLRDVYIDVIFDVPS